MAVDSRQTAPLAGFETGRNTNPEFAADGIALLHRHARRHPERLSRSGRRPAVGAARVTNVVSGVSGITPLTPALSAASAAPALVFTVFENDHYNIYATDTSRPRHGRRPGADDERRGAAAGQPPARHGGAAARDRHGRACRRRSAYEVRTTRPKLSLDAISQPTVGVGADRFGAYAAGGISFLFSDMLGDHMLGATVQSTEPRRGDRRAGDVSQSQVALELGLRRRAPAVCRPAASRRASRPSTARQAFVRADASAVTQINSGVERASRSIRSAACSASSSRRRPPHRLRRTRSRRSSSRRSPASCSTSRPRSCRGPTRSTSAKRPPRSSTTRRCSAPPARSSASAIASSTRRWPAR